MTIPPDPEQWAPPPRFGGCAEDPRRRASRHKVDALRCELGEVLDLSAIGMRVACLGKPPIRVGQSGAIRLHTPSGSLPLTGRAVWIRRIGLRRFEMGVEFLNVSRQVGAALNDLARFGFLREAASDRRQRSRRDRSQAASIRASMDLPDYYRILGVRANATDAEIRDAFRRLASAHHPDATGDPDDAAAFIRLHEAYEVLQDPQRRRSYDRRRAG